MAIDLLPLSPIRLINYPSPQNCSDLGERLAVLMTGSNPEVSIVNNKCAGKAAMLTITPTAVLDNTSESGPEVFAVIEGRKVFLPEDAKYVMQDRRGLWYYSSRKPRPKEGDWTPNKTSIACRTERGYVRALKTDNVVQWLDTCQRTVRMVSGEAGDRRPADD